MVDFPSTKVLKNVLLVSLSIYTFQKPSYEFLKTNALVPNVRNRGDYNTMLDLKAIQTLEVVKCVLTTYGYKEVIRE